MLACGGRAMDFGFTQEQEQLRAQVRRFLDAEVPLDRILEWSAKPQPLDRALWKRLAELGWPGITIPEAHGGLGLGCEDLIVVFEEMGKSLAPLPAPGVRVTPLAVVDPTNPAAEVHLDGVRLPASARLGAAGGAWPAIARVLDRMTIGLAAEMVGAADAALAMAVEYAKVRRQFGSPIGRFQGVKHRCAELLVDVESARSLVYYGAWAVGHAPAQAASYAAMLKAAPS